MRLLVASDAWHPQVNGVVRSLEEMIRRAPEHGFAARLLTPSDFRSVPMPGYPEIRLACPTPHRLSARWAEAAPSHVHVATEGPVGLAARRRCLAAGLPFTTSYHTRFPEYLAARAPVPEAWSYAYLRRFHAAAHGTMVSTASLQADLAARGFANLLRWTRGVDTDLFRPAGPGARPPPDLAGLAGPLFLTVGRLAVEKNLAAFLALDLPGTKVVVGDGPDRARLRALAPGARFLGTRTGAELAALYAACDVFVFPSLTDTFGIVMLEALASGLPVAAFPVPGPRDVIGPRVGVLDADLRAAALAALGLSRAACRAEALARSWDESARQFFGNIRAVRAPPGKAAA
ncbi:glycosyltransferase family 1 protein [Methylobacterium sp. NEAU 140]|uniref:glycosyltransferase family 4 protein n=1 Tax=Methylobacterium sp. NEAU 140 TaxID=3064945 RepID=UPI0027337E03|nr:glycosyltransferase family 1 protein [Methylobacterium sp. NEAU 140]MDP4021462.1 glycosyltransferase family 1 protein [Methylobacterium sp. NEAU 140]